MYVDLVQNTSLMVALTTLYSLLSRLNIFGETCSKILSGLLFGGVAIVGMQLPFHYAPGVIYDGRSIILAMAGLFGGGTTAVVSMLLAGAYRAHMGGAGIWAGLATIITCAGVGLVYRRGYGNRPDGMGILPLYGFGISVHITMLACQLLIQPWPAGLAVINRIWLPVFIIFPIATVLMGLFLGTEEHRIHVERNLRKSESVLSRSQSVGHVGSWEYDVDGNQLVCSDEVYRIFGLRPQKFAVTYEAFLDFIDSEDRSSVNDAYQRSINEGSDGFQIEHRIIRRDSGEVRFVHEKCEHIKNASGRVIRSIGIVQDNTDLKQVENTLRQSEKKLRKALDATPFPIAVVDLQDEKIDFWSQSALTLFGHTAPTVAEWYQLAYPDPDYRREVIERWKPLLERARGSNHPVNTGEYRIACKDGSIRICELYATFLTDALIVTFNDVTDRKKAEQEIRDLNRKLELRVHQRTTQLEEANKELEDFVYSVSHDLRAPLRSIGGFAEIIDRRFKASLNKDGQHYFDNIVKASRQMGVLIDDLLKFSRLGRKAITIEAAIGLDDVLKAAIETLSDPIKKKDARINIPEKMPAIQGDLTLATHIFINLLENAIKYQKPDEPPVVEIRFHHQDQFVIVSIADNGIGIEPEYHEKIFNIFQRLHNQTDYPGTGIGLAAVKKAVQIMGGEVWVESEPGKGSIFKIKLLMAETT